jgi:hypothetical protein
MGKAPVDLPDPLEQQSSAPGVGADDLLSQMAGDEIDRLLAEADRAPGGPEMRRQETTVDDTANDAVGDDDAVDEVEEPAAFAPAGSNLFDDAPAVASVPAAEAVMDEIAETAADVSNQLDELFAQLDDKSPTATQTDLPDEEAVSVPAVASEPVSSVAAEMEMTAQNLDQAIAQSAPVVKADDEADPATATTSVTQAKADPVATTVVPAATPVTASADAIPASAAAVASVVEAETSAVERSLLDTAIGTGDADAEARPDLSDMDDLPPAVPIYLKPLVWFNAPFAALSEGKRESLGKIAVVTMVNAVAVLLYVLIFRAR